MIERLLLDRGITPKKVAGTHGGEFASPCPACGGKDRFRCWPEQGEGGTWYCRGCDKGGDCIEFLRHFDGLSFGEACKKLGVTRKLTASVLPRHVRPPRFVPVEKFSAPAASWGEKAEKLLAHAEKCLAASPAMLDSLAARGLPLAAAQRFRLGWLPGERNNGCYFRDRASWGLPVQTGKDGKAKPLWIPGGLFIPTFDSSGAVVRLRVRRDDSARERFSPDMKYVVIPGSSMHPLLINPQSRAFVVVEAELDAMACAWACENAGLSVGALAVGTNMGKPDIRAHAALEKSLAILVALDFDEPGKDGSRPGANGYAFWEKTYPQARRWPTPTGKDPGEAVSLGVDLSVWLMAGLPPVFRVRSLARAAHVDANPPAPEKTVESVTPVPVPPQKNGGLTPEQEEVVGWLPPNCGRVLYAPAGPTTVLRPLAAAGLAVKKKLFRGEPDFVITGQENWTLDELSGLASWLHNYGDWVWQALYGVENDN